MIKTLGQRLRIARAQRGWRQEDLSKEAHVSVMTISRLESGSAEEVFASTVYALAYALKVSSDYLMGLRDDDPFRRYPRKGKPLPEAKTLAASQSLHTTGGDTCNEEE